HPFSPPKSAPTSPGPADARFPAAPPRQFRSTVPGNAPATHARACPPSSPLPDAPPSRSACSPPANARLRTRHPAESPPAKSRTALPPASKTRFRPRSSPSRFEKSRFPPAKPAPRRRPVESPPGSVPGKVPPNTCPPAPVPPGLPPESVSRPNPSRSQRPLRFLRSGEFFHQPIDFLKNPRLLPVRQIRHRKSVPRQFRQFLRRKVQISGQRLRSEEHTSEL